MKTLAGSLRAAALCCALAVSLAAQAAAQETGTVPEVESRPAFFDSLTDEKLALIVNGADQIREANLKLMQQDGPWQEFAPEKEEEPEPFEVSDEDRRLFAERGLIDSHAEWCGHPEEYSFLPFMYQQRHREDMNDEEAEYLTFVYSLSKKQFDGMYAMKAPCSEEDKAAVEAYLVKEMEFSEEPDPDAPANKKGIFGFFK